MARKPNTKTRGRILEAAFKLFHENGYRGVSMDDVARQAGIKKANLFHYHRTKEDLAAAVLDHASSCLKAGVRQFFSKDQSDPVRTVERIFAQSESMMKRNGCCRGCFVGNLAQELSDQNETLRAKIADYFDFWTAELAGALGRAQARKFFRKEMDPRQSAEAILALLEGATLFCKAQKKTRSLKGAGKMAAFYLEAQKV